MSLHPDQGEGRIPYLLSLNFGTERPQSLKVDLVLRGLTALQRDRLAAMVLTEVDAPWMLETIASLDSRVFSDQKPPAKQYLGLSLEAR